MAVGKPGLVHFRRHVLQISPALVLIPTTTSRDSKMSLGFQASSTALQAHPAYCKAALFGFAVAVPLVARAAVGVALVHGGSRLIGVAPGPRRLVVLEVLAGWESSALAKRRRFAMSSLLLCFARPRRASRVFGA